MITKRVYIFECTFGYEIEVKCNVKLLLSTEKTPQAFFSSLSLSLTVCVLSVQFIEVEVKIKRIDTHTFKRPFCLCTLIYFFRI